MVGGDECLLGRVGSVGAWGAAADGDGDRAGGLSVDERRLICQRARDALAAKRARG